MFQSGSSTREKFKWIFFFPESTASHDAAYIIYHLSEWVTACSFNSQLSVGKRHYVLKHFFYFYFILFLFLFSATCQILRPSHRILSHSRSPSNFLLNSLFLSFKYRRVHYRIVTYSSLGDAIRVYPWIRGKVHPVSHAPRCIAWRRPR